MDIVACVTKKPSRSWALAWIREITKRHRIREMKGVLVAPDTLVKYFEGFFRIVAQDENQRNTASAPNRLR